MHRMCYGFQCVRRSHVENGPVGGVYPLPRGRASEASLCANFREGVGLRHPLDVTNSSVHVLDDAIRESPPRGPPFSKRRHFRPSAVVLLESSCMLGNTFVV